MTKKNNGVVGAKTLTAIFGVGEELEAEFDGGVAQGFKIPDLGLYGREV
jgi:hypothetical protein